MIPDAIKRAATDKKLAMLLATLDAAMVGKKEKEKGEVLNGLVDGQSHTGRVRRTQKRNQEDDFLLE